MKIANRTFIISGGSSGLGLAAAQLLHSHGAYVALLDRADAPPSPTGDQVRFFRGDITNTDDVERAVRDAAAWAKQTGAWLGGVLCAAGVGSAGKIVNEAGEPFSLEVFNTTLAVNVSGTFDLLRRVCSHLVRDPPDPSGERGVIIMVSSIAAFGASPTQTAYAASKGAIRSMTLPLARDLARYGIRVNTIAPGTFGTPMISMISRRAAQAQDNESMFPPRLGKPEEFAETVRWMIECGYANGETIKLTGGQRLASRL